jgi:hypothetical protein
VIPVSLDIPWPILFGTLSHLSCVRGCLCAAEDLVEENSRKMELSYEEFMALSPEQVHAFVLQKNLLDKEDADKLVKNKVKGSTLMESSAQEVKDLYGLPGGPANELVKHLKRNFPGEGFPSQMFRTSWLCYAVHDKTLNVY